MTNEWKWEREMLTANDGGERVYLFDVKWSPFDDYKAKHRHLIAAAPDMLKALEEMTDIVASCTFSTIRIRGQYVDRKEAVGRAHTALAKAKGEAT